MESEEQHSGLEQGVVIDNRYEVVELISATEKEAIFRARDKALDDTLIQVKVFYASKDTSKSDLARFRNEVIIARRLGQQNISRVYDLGKFDKHYYYITLADLDGTSLQDILEEHAGQGLPYKLALGIIYQLTNALVFAHDKGVIHRNISPESIVVKYNNKKLEQVYLTNFGYGKLLGVDFGFTRTGEIIGSPAHMAPEQMRGEKLDGRVDQYALGILTYELITGKKPFSDLQMSPLQALQIKDKVPDIQSVKPNTPDWINELVQIAAANDKSMRFSSAAEMRRFILDQNSSKNKSSKVYDKIKLLFGVLNEKLSSTWKLLVGLILLSGITILSIYFHSEILNLTIGSPLAKDRSEISTQKILAAVVGNEEASVFQLLQSGVSPHTTDKTGSPIICLAAQLGYVNIVYTILNSDPSAIMDADSEGRTALILAVQKKKIDVIELLLKQGADPSLKDKSGVSAIDYAKQDKSDDILRIFSN